MCSGMLRLVDWLKLPSPNEKFQTSSSESNSRNRFRHLDSEDEVIAILRNVGSFIGRHGVQYVPEDFDIQQHRCDTLSFNNLARTVPCSRFFLNPTSPTPLQSAGSPSVPCEGHSAISLPTIQKQKAHLPSQDARRCVRWLLRLPQVPLPPTPKVRLYKWFVYCVMEYFDFFTQNFSGFL